MSQLPTTTQLLNDEALLRLEIAKVLWPEPRTHFWVVDDDDIDYCMYCGVLRDADNNEDICQKPRSATGPLEVLVRQMLEKCPCTDPFINKLKQAIEVVAPDRQETWSVWFIFKATPAERAVCCLRALGRARVEDAK